MAMTQDQNIELTILSNPSYEQFLIATQILTKPIIIKQSMEESKILKDWNLTYFYKHLANREIVTYQTEEDGRYRDQGAFKIKADPFLFSLETPQKDKKHYFVGGLPLDYFYELENDLEYPKFLNHDSIISRRLKPLLWFGAPSQTDLHYDIRYNVMMQVWGEKKILLYPPTKMKNFYPENLPSLSMFSKIINPSKTNLNHFPRFKKITPIKVYLKRGDILFIPLFWWHFVQGQGCPNLTITYHWMESFKKMIRSPYYRRYFFNHDGIQKVTKSYFLFAKKKFKSFLSYSQ